ncbi:MAG: HAD family phosphatase [Ginsengibacter sp.]
MQNNFDNITAIIFDLGGVLLNIDYNKTKDAFEQLGVKDFHNMYSQAAANPLFERLEIGAIEEHDFYNHMQKHVDPVYNAKDIEQAWNAMLLNFRLESLNELKRIRKIYKIYLLSNTNYIHLKEFNKIYDKTVSKEPFASLFDNVYFSHEIGLRKPNIEPFEYVVNENNLIPQQTLFIDDSLQNVEGARKAGLKAIHFTGEMRVESLGL